MQFALDDREASRLARGKDKKQARELLRELGERPDNDVVFVDGMTGDAAAFVGAGGRGADPDAIGMERRNYLLSLRDSGIVFEIAGRFEARGWNAEISVAVAVERSLGEYGVGQLKQRRKKPFELAITGPGAIGDAAIGDDEGGTGLLGFVIQVGPDFSFEDNEKRGTQGAQGSADAGDVIERRVEDAVREVWDLAFSGDAAGNSGRGKIDGDEGFGGLERTDQGDGGGDFAGRDGVEPNRAGFRPSEGLG